MSLRPRPCFFLAAISAFPLALTLLACGDEAPSDAPIVAPSSASGGAGSGGSKTSGEAAGQATGGSTTSGKGGAGGSGSGAATSNAGAGGARAGGSGGTGSGGGAAGGAAAGGPGAGGTIASGGGSSGSSGAAAGAGGAGQAGETQGGGGKGEGGKPSAEDAGASLRVDAAEPGKIVSEGIRIAKSKESATPKTMYSVALGEVAAGTHVRLATLVPLSRCNPNDTVDGTGDGTGSSHSPCEGKKAYSYNPEVAARIVLDRGGDAPLEVLEGWTGYKCFDETHHCPVIVQLDGKGIGQGAGKDARIAVQVIAYSSDAGKDDIIEVEGDCKGNDYNPDDPADTDKDPFNDGLYCEEVVSSAANGQIADGDTRGQLTVVRAEPGAASQSLQETKPVVGSIPISTESELQPAVVFLRTKLTNLYPGDVVEASAVGHFRNDDAANGSYSFNHFVSLQLFLADSQDDTKPGNKGLRLSPSMGQNCFPQPAEGCRREMVGAVTMPKDTKPGTTMWLIASVRAVDNSDKAKTVKSPQLKVVNNPGPKLQARCTSAARGKGEAPCGT